MSFARPAPADVSYLQARESGYGYGRARASSAALPGLAPPQRDITGELVDQPGAGGATGTLRVFLRVRPQLEGDFGELPSEERKPVLERPNDCHLLMHAPKDSATYKNGMNGNGKLTHRYTFSHIFPPETDQRQLFRQTTLNHVTEFVNGHSCLLFTYGATNSGKTYTVQGTPTEPGLLPNALDVLFNSVSSRLYPRLDVQPRGFADVCLVSARDEEAARRVKREALRLGAEEVELGVSRAGSEESLYKSQESLATSIDSVSSEVRLCPEVEGRRRESAAVCMENQPRTRFSVWVSYVEIYNEYVYDLLERPGPRRRTALHLGLDRRGQSYVKGLRHVPVRSADEAIQVVRAGRQNLHFASNRLNHHSSRSHCVFTVRLIRLLDTDNPSVARVSHRFSVCDLAGSERVEKTLAAGARMKEAGNINSSLMVLGRCMKAMRQAQKSGASTAAPSASNASLVPYRDSKLTRLFQAYFCGGGGGLASRVTMIVNVSPSPLVFDETIQVLKFSALAKQVSVQQPEKRRPPTRFSIMARRSVAAAAAAVGGRPRPLLGPPGAEAMDATAEVDEEHQNLLDLVESLRHQLVESRRENIGLESRIRQELCAEFEQHVVQIEKDWQARVQEAERYAESRTELQLTAVAAGIKAEYSRKRRRTGDSEDEAEDEQPDTDELKEARERLAAAEERCLLLEQQLEAEAADRHQQAQRDQQRQQELARLAAQLAEQREVCERVGKERDEAEERHRRLVESGAAGQAEELGRQVAQLQQELRFRDMDLRETRECLQEGGDEFLQLEAASERLRAEAAELRQQLAQREEALRDQQALAADLEQLLAARSQRVAELETQLERRRPASAAATEPAIPEEEENPAELSYGSRMRALRSRTGAVLLRQTARAEAEPSPQTAPQTAHQTAPQTARQTETADQASQTAELASQTAEMRSETAEEASQTAERDSAEGGTQTEEWRPRTAEEETQTAEDRAQTAERGCQTAGPGGGVAEETQTAEHEAAKDEADRAREQQRVAEAQAESARLAAELSELQTRAGRLETELRTATDQLTARTAECSELRSQQETAAAETQQLQQQVRQLTEQRDRLSETHRELEDLQRQYKQTLHQKTEAEADAAVCEREMKSLRAELERERQGDGSLQERLKARDAEVAMLKDSRDHVSEALRIIRGELEAKTEELRQNNAVELRAQLERAEAESGHLRDEVERKSNELLKINIHVENLKKQVTQRDEDLQKIRDERNRCMQISEQDIRRKNEELNRERHETSHLRDLMARLTPRSSSTLQSELEAARADCRRKDDRIEQLESRLRASQAELAACTPTPTPRSAASRSVHIVDDDESDVTPMVLRGRSGRRTGSRAPPPPPPESEEEAEPAGRRRTRQRRAANRSAVRFTDENVEPEASESGSSVSGGGGGGRGAREPLTAIAEQQGRPAAGATTPADQQPPPRTVKSTGTKRKLFKRCSDQIMECSPVQTAEKRMSPRTVVTRSLRSRKK